jgi:hypothetical protein
MNSNTIFRGGVKGVAKTMRKKNKGIRPISFKKKNANISKNLKIIVANMNKTIDNPIEYLKKSQKFFKAIISMADTALNNEQEELYSNLQITSGYITHNVYVLFKKNQASLKNSLNNLANLFGKIGLNKNNTYSNLLNEELANESPLEYLEFLIAEIDNMYALHDKSIVNKDNKESTKVSILMGHLAEEIQKSIKEAIDHFIPRNETGLADLMNSIFKKAFK